MPEQNSQDKSKTQSSCPEEHIAGAEAKQIIIDEVDEFIPASAYMPVPHRGWAQ
jgi:hypothetical protein